MFTPGYENENKTKPSITKAIEETDPGLTPEQAAAAMLQGKCLLTHQLRRIAHKCGDFSALWSCSTQPAAASRNGVFQLLDERLHPADILLSHPTRSSKLTYSQHIVRDPNSHHYLHAYLNSRK